jgi:hypothetical protein
LTGFRVGVGDGNGVNVGVGFGGSSGGAVGTGVGVGVGVAVGETVLLGVGVESTVRFSAISELGTCVRAIPEITNAAANNNGKLFLIIVTSVRWEYRAKFDARNVP